MTADQERGSYLGHPPWHERPGTFEFVRRLPAADFDIGGNGEFTKFELAKSSAWLVNCPQLTTAQQALVNAQAVVRRLDIRIVGAANGQVVRIADEETPTDRHKSADNEVPIVRKDYGPHHEIQDVYIVTENGPVVLEFSIWFDLAIPLAEMQPLSPQP